MNTKRLSLTVFFIVLTLSIGLVSVNQPLSSFAQNNALSQSGNGESEQETEQEQSSSQDNQVVSGDSSVLSGNNVECQGQNNKDTSEVIDICNVGPSFPSDTAILKIITLQRANCHFHSCPMIDGVVTLRSIYGTQSVVPHTQTSFGEATFELRLHVGATYQIIGEGAQALPWYFTFDVSTIDNVERSCSGVNQCSFVMPPDGATVRVNFHYKCNDSAC